jgi:hypothetical protein
MMCSVSPCNRQAAVMVQFRTSPVVYGYCGFHGLTRDGHPRWRADKIAMMTTRKEQHDDRD